MKQCQTKSVTLVLGGVRSGKSHHAQQLAEAWDRVTFVATAEHRDDAEMRAKIERHRADRPLHWKTIEEPLQLHLAIEQASADSDAVLVDCLTLFAANLLEASADDLCAQQAAIDRFCHALVAAPCTMILVSNEVGSGVVPAYASGRRFRDLVGELNQRVAALADTVLLMVAGLPLAVKSIVAVEAPQ